MSAQQFILGTLQLLLGAVYKYNPMHNRFGDVSTCQNIRDNRLTGSKLGKSPPACHGRWYLLLRSSRLVVQTPFCILVTAFSLWVC